MMGTIITVIILIMIIGALITYWPIVLAVTAIGVIIVIVIKLKKRSGHEKYIKDYYSTDNSSNIHSSYDFKKTDKDIDDLDGVEFEKYISRLLWMNGYTFVQTTKASGDYGIDIIATKGNQKYGIQCKRYSGTVGNHAVMEAYTGAAYYQCDVAVVCTSNYFTNAAKEQASKVGVQLWDRDEIEYLIKIANNQYYEREKSYKDTSKEYEKYILHLLEINGYTSIQSTKETGNYGIDFIAFKDSQKYGIACKKYRKNIDSHTVMEAYTGATYYQCDVAVVFTTKRITNSAKEQALKNGVQIWDKDILEKMIRNSNGKYRKKEKYNETKENSKPEVVIDCPQCGKKFRVYADKGSMLEMKCPHCSYKFIERV